MTREVTPLGVRRARQKARELLALYRIRTPIELDVTAIARLHRAEVDRGDLSGSDAWLARVGRESTIRVSDHVTHPGAERFNIAHELGHLVLQHATSAATDLCRAPNSDRVAEAEASAFAAELLMPEAMLRRRCEVSPVSLGPARAIAAEFAVSLMAAAVRFVELTSERCALVFARDRHVAWAARSATFLPAIARGRRLDDASVAWDWFAHGSVGGGCQLVPADAWLDHEAASDHEIWEDATPVPDAGGVMSLLWIPDGVAAPFDI